MAGPDGQLSPRRFRLALVAHDAKKAGMAEFVAAHAEAMRGFDIYATGTTGARILERCPGLSVTRLKSGPLGGDQQIGALIGEGRIDALIFFVDPLSPHPHDVDVKALTRLGLVYDIPMALNRATAERIMRAIGDALPSHDVVLGRAEDESRGSHGR